MVVRGSITMLKYLTSVLTLLVVFFFLPTYAYAEEILSLHVEIVIESDSSIQVQETIVYDFDGESRHGIFRELPTHYETPYGTKGVDLVIQDVLKDDVSEPFTENKSGQSRILKIGDATILISGVHTYRLTYKVEGAFNEFEQFDELYWNAIGNKWDVPIRVAEIEVIGHGLFTEVSCYRGEYGSEQACADGSLMEASYRVSALGLMPGEGVTIAVSLPKGTVMLPSVAQKTVRTVKNNAIVFLPVLVFIVMFTLWRKHGKDTQGEGTIIPQYDPPSGVSPAIVGSIIDGNLDNRDITAEIIYLAERGYITISREEKKVLFMKSVEHSITWKGAYEDLEKTDQLVANILFKTPPAVGSEIELGELKKDTGIVKRRKKLQRHIDQELMKQGYFLNMPGKTKGLWSIGGIVGVVFVSFIILAVTGTAVSILWFIAVAVSSVVVLLFSVFMPKLTKKGTLAREHIKGFKDFLSVTEKERLDFHNAPERSPKEFMAHLPYAIALGVEKKWAKQFEGLSMDNPTWYQSSPASAFSVISFTDSLSSFNTSIEHQVSAASGGSASGGGGFSGGGFGGGGGGSW